MEKMDISPLSSSSSSKSMSSSKKTNKRKSKTQKKILWKKRATHLPISNIISQFEISDDNIKRFSRNVNSPYDCVINALQIMGFIDKVTSNILRISDIGDKFGFNKIQIEKIFILLKGTNFDFIAINNFNDFSQTVEQNLLPGHVIFAGYMEIINKGELNEKGESDEKIFQHVFLIGRYLNGKIVLMDPQLQALCDINKCQDLIRNKDEYYILYNSKESLTKSQLTKLGFIK